jgi:glycogen debranching enzyme
MIVGRHVVETPLGLVRLASDEHFVGIRASPLRLPTEPEDPLEVLLRMGGVESPADLGSGGPLVASAANVENAANPDLRRYEAKFGRDAFYAAEFLADVYPGLELGTVRFFSAYQATGISPQQQAEPGKIANHVRDPMNPIAQELSRVRGRRWPWFGATDTTVQFLLATCRVIGRDLAVADEIVLHPPEQEPAGEPIWRDDRELRVAEVVHDAAAWLLRALSDQSIPGLLWVPLNDADSFTVWTDSPNWFSHRGGRLARPPVAPVQLQAQAYDALIALVELADVLPSLRLDPAALRSSAEAVRQRFFDFFPITDDRGTFLASGLERTAAGTVPIAARTVSMGFVLDSALVRATAAPDDLELALVRQLFGPDMLSPFGIVGRSRDDVRFEEFDYHSQVWAFATYKVAKGLARLGYARLASLLATRVLRQCADGIYPENVGAGEDDVLRYCPHVLTVSRPAPDGRLTTTVKERPPAPHAAWTVAAVLAILEDRWLAPDSGPGRRRGVHELEQEILASLGEVGQSSYDRNEIQSTAPRAK